MWQWRHDSWKKPKMLEYSEKVLFTFIHFLSASKEYFGSCLFMFRNRLENLQCCTEPLLPSRSLWSALPLYVSCSLALLKYVSREEGINKIKKKKHMYRVHWKLSRWLVWLRILRHLGGVTLEQKGHCDRRSARSALWLTIYWFCTCQVSFLNCV